MSEPNWELKDRRMAWMNMNTACSTIIAARIEAGLYKPKDNKEAMKELLDAIGIEFSVYLTLGTGDGTSCGGEEKPSVTIAPQTVPKKTKTNGEKHEWFCSTGGCGNPVSDKVKTFSEDKFGRILCFSCQTAERAKIEGASKISDLEV